MRGTAPYVVNTATSDSAGPLITEHRMSSAQESMLRFNSRGESFGNTRALLMSAGPKINSLRPPTSLL